MFADEVMLSSFINVIQEVITTDNQRKHTVVLLKITNFSEVEHCWKMWDNLSTQLSKYLKKV